MPTEALGRSQMLAGIPAGLGSLQNLLAVAVEPNPGKQNLVDAFETDPALLLAALSISRDAAADLANWHNHIDGALLQAAALTLAGRTNTGLLANGEGHWQRAIRQSLIADELAKKITGMDGNMARLASLLAGIVDAAPEIADEMTEIGCTPLASDAVRFHRESKQGLIGSPALLRTVASAYRLRNALGSPDPLSEELIEWVDDLLDLDHETAYEAIGIASWRYEQAMRNVRKADTAQSLADAHAGAVFYRALLKSDPSEDFMTKVTQSASYLFGFTGACHFKVIADPGYLTTEIDGEPVRISFDDPRSAVANAFREQSLSSNTIEQATLIEHQLLTRLGGQAFYCVPLRGSAGLLFLTADIGKINHMKGDGNVLVSAFADAVSDLYEREQKVSAGAGTISLDHFKARAREITHEVNNPLAIVQNYLKTMALKLESQAGAASHGVTREIEAISTELVRVSGLLQKFGRIGEEDKLVYSDTDVNGLITELTGLVAADRQITVEMHLDRSVPVLELAGDALRQVLLNILKNAVEALVDVAGPRIEVSTQGAVNLGGRHYLEIVITDNGPGMTAADRLELFNTGGMSSKGEGRGLGLGIAKGLLDEMGGLIGIRDAHAATDETGTSFQVLIPFETQ